MRVPYDGSAWSISLPAGSSVLRACLFHSGVCDSWGLAEPGGTAPGRASRELETGRGSPTVHTSQSRAHTLPIFVTRHSHSGPLAPGLDHPRARAGQLGQPLCPRAPEIQTRGPKPAYPASPMPFLSHHEWPGTKFCSRVVGLSGPAPGPFLPSSRGAWPQDADLPVKWANRTKLKGLL